MWELGKALVEIAAITPCTSKSTVISLIVYFSKQRDFEEVNRFDLPGKIRSRVNDRLDRNQGRSQSQIITVVGEKCSMTSTGLYQLVAAEHLQ